MCIMIMIYIIMWVIIIMWIWVYVYLYKTACMGRVCAWADGLFKVAGFVEPPCKR